MIKNSCKWEHDFTHYLLEDTSDNIPVEVEFGHEKDRISEVDYYINQLYEKTSLLT